MCKLKRCLKNFRQPFMVTLILMIICGLIFPLLLTGLAQVIFPKQANGSLIESEGKVIGSMHVGQEFTEPYFMKCRPSAVHYNTYKEDENGNKTLSDGSEFSGVASGSQNLAPGNPKLKERIEKDIKKFLEENPDVKKEDIPIDLITASGSGLDPHISYESAKVQIPAISKASGISEEELLKIVDNNKKGKMSGVFGEETVNVLLVNIEIHKKLKQ